MAPTENDPTVTQQSTETKPPMQTNLGGNDGAQTPPEEKAQTDFEAKLSEATRKIQELEEKIARQAPTSDIVTAIQSAITPREKQVSEDEILGDMVLTNPVEFVKKVEERVEKRLTTMKQQETVQNEFWTNFYKEHPHLKNHDVLVKNVMNANLLKLKDLPAKEASQIIANEATGIYRSILGENGTETKMPSGGFNSLPPSSAAINNATQKKHETASSFTDEINSFQKNKK